MKQQLLHTLTTVLSAAVTISLLALPFSLPAELLLYEGFDIPAGEIHGTAGETSFGWKPDGDGEVNWWAWKEDEGPDAFYHGVTDE